MDRTLLFERRWFFCDVVGGVFLGEALKKYVSSRSSVRKECHALESSTAVIWWSFSAEKLSFQIRFLVEAIIQSAWPTEIAVLPSNFNLIFFAV